MAAIKHCASTILHNPVFEGSEKRLEIDFLGGPNGGLRLLPRSALDELMDLAACTIVSSRSNDHLDAYVLSESSLFVYPTKWVLKTCGTTKLLNSIPRLLELTAELGLHPVRCKYTRASFLFPENQPFPHSGFDDEVGFLDGALEGVMGAGHSSVLGDEADGLQWHVYVANSTTELVKQPTYNFEVCMTELGLTAAQQFFRTDKFVSTKQTTADTGILNLRPNALIDDYVFEPCGYSMNSIENAGLMTIHVTPEPGFSYASLEVSGGPADITDPSMLLASALKIFEPGKVSVALSVDLGMKAGSLGGMIKVPPGYYFSGVSSSKLPGGGSVSHFTLVQDDGGRPASPQSVLHHVSSFLSEATTPDGGYSSGSDPEPASAEAEDV